MCRLAVAILFATCLGLASAASKPIAVPTPTPTTAAYGKSYSGEASITGTFEGLPQCQLPASPEDLLAGISSNLFGNPVSQTCGMCLSVTGSVGTAVVKIVDDCEGCALGTNQLNLNPKSYAAVLGTPKESPQPITFKPVRCPKATLTFRIHPGSNPYWFAIQISNYEKYIKKVQVDVSGVWQDLALLDWNHWVAMTGLGNGPFTLRVIDVDGIPYIQKGIPFIKGQPLEYVAGGSSPKIVWTPSPAPTRTPTKFLVTPTPGPTKYMRTGVVYQGTGLRWGYFVDNGTSGNCELWGTFTKTSLVAGISTDWYANSLTCATCVKVTGPAGDVVVEIVDQFAEGNQSTFALNPPAADAVLGSVVKQGAISFETVDCLRSGSLRFRIKKGSNPFWMGIQVLNIKSSVKLVEIEVAGKYVPLVRQEWNHWVGTNLGKGPFTVRTSLYRGTSPIIVSNIPLIPEQIFPA